MCFVRIILYFSLSFTNKNVETKVGKKSLCIGIILSIIQECSGIFVLLNYSISIFAEAESDITPHQSLIVISVIQIIGSYVSVYFIDRAGRKVSLSRKIEYRTGQNNCIY